MSTTVSSTTSTTNSYSQNRNDFDSTTLAEVGYETKLAKADSLEVKVTKNEAKITAYEELDTLLDAVMSPLETLRSEPGSSGKSKDVFLNRTAYLSSSDSTSASSILSASVEDGTDIGTHEIEVSQVATVERLGGDTVSSRSTSLGLTATTVTIGTQSAEDGSDATSTTIDITSTMTLGDIADAINAVTTTSGVAATITQVSDSEYMLVLSGTTTDREITLSAGTGVTALSELGLTDETTGDKVTPLQEAQGAEIIVDGVTVTRSTNTVEDAIDGVTLNLYKADVGNTLSLEIDNDLSEIQEEITTFVDAYNSFRDFVLTNQTTNSDGSASDDATLFSDSLLRGISTSLQSMLTSNVDGVSLATIGISLDSSNKLVIDTSTLEEALTSDIDSVMALFSYNVTTSSGNLQLLSHGDGPTSADFTLDLTVDGSGTLTGATVNGSSAYFTVSNGSVRGVAGTEYEGLVFVFTGSTSQSVTVSITQGIADQMYQAIDVLTDQDTGTLTSAVSTLEEQNSDLEEKITYIQDRASAYRDYLLEKYSKIEAKLAEAQTTLDLLEALNKAENSSS